ncbi:MAG: site-specific integrase [Holosporaceae bacterium]|jgi:integrase|nr:site-specific integrase [Holosporaceae bacterium]
MAIKWIKVENVKGLRYYEHTTRIYKKRKDRNFSLTYKLNGQTKTEALGWESDGWTVEKASAVMNELRQNQKTGQGPRTLAEKRELAQKQKKEEETQTKEEESKIITFSEVFEKYSIQAKQDKDAKTHENEVCIFKNWIAPDIEDKTMDEIVPDTLEQIKKKMSDAGRAVKTINHVLATIRQVFNYAINRDLYFGNNPVNKIKKPSSDNRRMRFLSKKESEILLEHLKESSHQLHDMALLSLHCGLRAGEIFNLTWNDVDFEHEILSIKDTKSGRNRSAIMTLDIKKMLAERKQNTDSGELVFSSNNGQKITEVSDTFTRIIDKLGFNNKVSDPRQKVVFHTLRHTYASWLAMSGVDLYTVQKLMGHSTISTTERYSHLAPDHLKKAVEKLESNYAYTKSK